jgi:hypothetical protein
VKEGFFLIDGCLNMQWDEKIAIFFVFAILSCLLGLFMVHP